MTKPRKVDWSAGDWLNGTRRLTNEQRGVYVTAISLIYDIGGPISRQEINRECIGSARSTKRIVETLLDRGKLILTEDGMIDQPRCQLELEIARKRLETYRKLHQKHGALGGRPPNENNDLQNPIRARSKGEAKEKEDFIKPEGSVGRSAPARDAVAQEVRPMTEEERGEIHALAERAKAALRGEVPKGIRDVAAYGAVVTDNKFRAVCIAVNDAARRLDGKAREEAWQAVAAAQEAGSWKAMRPVDAKLLRQLYQWAKEQEPEAEAA